MAKKIDLKKSVKGLTFFTRALRVFGSRERAGDQSIFDSRGAITITNKEIKKRNGDIVNIRGIKDAGGGESIVISRPSAGNDVDPSRAMESYRGWVYAAVKAISDEIGSIEWRLFRNNKDGDKEEIDSHPLLDFLEGVNDFQVGVEFKRTIAQHILLAGNAYVLLGDVTDENSVPKSMHLLNPGSVKVKLDKMTYPYKVTGYSFTVDGRQFSYAKHQIVQIKDPDPSNPYQGIGAAQGIAEWISNDRNSTEFLNQFFKNGAQIGVTFETDMTSEEQLHELRDSFNEQHAGVGNAYKAMFLPKGVTKSANEVKFDDIGMDTVSDKNRDMTLAGFRLPKTILGAAESETNRATAETADYVFAKRTVKPLMELICAYFNEFLVPRFGQDIYLSFTDPVPEDKVSKSNDLKNAVGAMPVMTVNEAREEYLGMEEIEGGDKLLAPNNFAPATNAGEYSPLAFALGDGKEKEKKVKTRKRPPVGYIPTRTRTAKTQFAKNVETRKSMADDLSEKLSKIVADIKSKGIKEMTNQEYDEVILKEKRERDFAYAKEIRSALVKLNDDQKDEVMKNLAEATKSTKALDVTKLFDKDKWVNLTINALKPIAKTLFGKEALRALELIDEPGLDVENTPEAKEAINNAMKLMAETYNQNTVDLLQDKLTEGLEQGFGVQKLGELVSDIYAWKNEYAAERVALTESNRISSEAGKIAWKQSGVVKEIKWVTSRNDVCDFCEDMEGETISIEKDFFDKGDEYELSDGQVMNLDYSAVGGPPLHPNCHCGIRPVVDTRIRTVDILGSGKEAENAIIELTKLDHATR